MAKGKPDEGKGWRGAGIAWQTTNPTAIYTHNLQINFTPNCGQSICHALSPKRVPSGEEEKEGKRMAERDGEREGVGNNLRLSSLDLSRSWHRTPQARGERRVRRGEASSNANLMQQCSRAEQQKERKEQMEQAKQPKRKSQGRQEDEESRSRSQRASSLPRHCSGKVSSGPSAKYIFDNCEYLSSLHPVQGQVKGVDYG